MAQTTRVPRPMPYLIGLSALAYWVQGWAAGTQDFSQTQSTGIILAEVLNAAWMVWLLVVARRRPDLEPASLGR
jgi:hypothetical protein